MSSLQCTNPYSIVKVRGKPYKKCIILADVNIPYKFSIERNKNNLFFCINADQFSEQSFHSVVLNLDTRLTSIIPGIRNGFASTVDHATGNVYLGGSDGIFQFNYNTQDIMKPAIVHGVDIFDIYYDKALYYVDTANQNLHIYENGESKIVKEVEGYLMQHFVKDDRNSLVFINSTGLFTLPKGAKSPILCSRNDLNFRGAAVDTYGVPHFIAQNGIYTIDEQSKQLVNILSMENGYGLAFDKDNNIIFSDERTVAKLIPFPCV